ncbi:NADH dehydrogenase [Nocardia terpenica]|uniref:complex I subunit 5 family protein n=1 Tax=Nocardia terpenica TaxID=455432 RepID=UPI0018940B1C|nr:complex I subunit 5 family protein [Nocardia terpenica]MBF6060034.1 NADH dehydrogenase [Nocardia terpenica]MBF6102425.1 NADH dehydrogenase [Nocardia terpenica]MBF6111384.1 NADH dehydrogenase [Nocardia terpenica]MBF6117515.1 NADH dehydrogenase [Nocardia terpenica]MBF6150644.1 NADH dehydrogenase [Nocardia terpenica]
MTAAALPPAAIAVPIAGACLLLALGRFLPRRAVDLLASGVAVAGVVVAAALLCATNRDPVVAWAGGWQPSAQATVGIVLVADRLAAALTLAIAALTALALVFGWRYFDHLQAHYPALILLFAAGMTGFTLTGDLFDMFVFFELMSVAAYALTGLRIEEPESVQGGLNFAVVNSLGAYICLFGIALLYARTGQLGLPQLGTALHDHGREPVVAIAFAFIATGWLVKAAIVPFHFWLADAHAVAPAPVCVLFSGVMAPLGIYGLARVYWTVFDTAITRAAAHRMMLVLALITAALGTVMCLLQRHIKRMLAYSTIAHIGLFLLGVAALSSTGIAACALYLAGHAAVKGALFLMTGILLARYRSLDEHRLYRRARRHRALGALFLLAGLLLAGLPVSGAGLGKALLEESGHSVALAGFVVVVSAATGAAVLRVGLRVFFGVGAPPREDDEADETTGAHEYPDVVTARGRTPVTMVGTVVVLLAVAGLLGSPAVGRWLGPAAAEFGASDRYRGQALHGIAAIPAVGPEIGWTTAGIVLGAVSALLAAALAAVTLTPPRWARSRVPDRSPVRAVVHVLHRAHSGHLGDYAAWLVVGSVVIAALIAG